MTSRCGGSTASAMPTSPTRCPRSCSGRRRRCELLLVGGRAVVEGGELRTADVAQLAAANRAGARELARRAGLR